MKSDEGNVLTMTPKSIRCNPPFERVPACEHDPGTSDLGLEFVCEICKPKAEANGCPNCEGYLKEIHVRGEEIVFLRMALRDLWEAQIRVQRAALAVPHGCEDPEGEPDFIAENASLELSMRGAKAILDKSKDLLLASQAGYSDHASDKLKAHIETMQQAVQHVSELFIAHAMKPIDGLGKMKPGGIERIDLYLSEDLLHYRAIASDLASVARSYERWEADLIMSEEAWMPNGMATTPRIPQELWDRLIEMQEMRNRALKFSKEYQDKILTRVAKHQIEERSPTGRSDDASPHSQEPA